MKDQENLYRFFDADLYNLYHGAIAAYSTRRDFLQLYPEVVVQMLLNCKEFKTLDDHAVSYLRSRQRQIQYGRSPVKWLISSLFIKLASTGQDLPVSDREVQAVKLQLESFTKEGFLKSDKEFRDEITDTVSALKMSSKDPKKIRFLGIPTRNREKLLTRCVQSYLENLSMYNRDCRLYIVDDSDEGSLDHHLSHGIAELSKRYDTGFIWINRSYRHKLIDELIKTYNIPDEVIEFALLGDWRCDIRTGASRNTLLLMAAGEPSVHVDDDTLCQVTPFPEMEDGIAVSSKAEGNQYWYDISSNGSPAQPEVGTCDFLTLHESLLGRHPGILVREQEKINIDYFGSGLLDLLGCPDARTAVTYLGALGDSGLFRHWQRLCFEGDSFKRLIENGSTYRNYLCTRHLFRGAVQRTINDGPFCMAMNIGLDTRHFLPPFMPVQRNQDGIFGQLLYLCFKQSCRGYSPYAIIHDPPDRPSHVDLTFALSVGPLRTPDILQAILRTLHDWPFGLDPSENLSGVGKYLCDLGQLPPSYFKVKARKHCWQLIHNQMNYLQRCLDERWDAPAYWQDDVRQVLANFQELIRQKNLCVPCDLPGSETERLTLFQELVGKFGQVLIHWPVMWEAAVDLNKKMQTQKSLSNENLLSN